MDLKDYLDALTTEMVKEIGRIIGDNAEALGAEYTRQLEMQFLSGYIGSVLYGTLNKKQDDVKGKKARANAHIERARDLKEKMQDAVATGFAAGFIAYTEVPTEYYCKIVHLDAPSNKEPC